MANTVEDNEMRKLCLTRAKSGDGQFAIAWALIELADSQVGIARAIHKLGVADAATPFGALEVLADKVGSISTSLDTIAAKVEEHALGLER